MMADSTYPVQVPASSLPSIAATLLRYGLTALGAWFVTHGWLNDQQLNDAIGGILIVASTGYGAWKSHSNVTKLQNVAGAVPDAVAQVK
jgi:hypothetical protein